MQKLETLQINKTQDLIPRILEKLKFHVLIWKFRLAIPKDVKMVLTDISF